MYVCLIYELYNVTLLVKYYIYSHLLLGLKYTMISRFKNVFNAVDDEMIWLTF